LDGGSGSRKPATYTQNKSTQTSIRSVEFEPTIIVFERAKIVHVLDRAATVIGPSSDKHIKSLVPETPYDKR
jgi:hypothetical protein